MASFDPEPAIKTLEVAGDSVTMGWQLGRAMGQFMHVQLSASAKWQKVQSLRTSSACRAMEQTSRRQFPHLVREIEGLAAGAEMPFEAIFAWQCRYELQDLESEGGAEGCTTLACPSGYGSLVAHNEDAMALYHGHCWWVQAHPDEGLAYRGFHYPGAICGNCFFVNEAGVVHSTNHIAAKPRSEGLPRQIVVRAAVNSPSLEKLVALLQRTDRASGCHHTVTQVGCGTLLSIEAPATGCSVRVVDGPFAHSNHLIHAGMASIPQQIGESSLARQERADALLARLPQEPEKEQLLEILSDQSQGALSLYRDDMHDPGQTACVATAAFEVGKDSVNWEIYVDPRQPPLYCGAQRGPFEVGSGG
jgi:hypothetical protein